MPRKRTHDEMVTSESQEKKETPSLLHTIRNMWEFASTMQFIFMFGKALKIDDDFDIEDFETECLKPGYSEKLEEIGLTLLKWISSHRGLNYDLWDEYTRRQYRSKAPDRNPYGEDEEPKRFRDFDILTKIRILHQLTVWTLWNPDRLREKMTEHQREVDQLEWRVEEFGYDKEDRQYYLLDDNRFYRRTEPPLPPAPRAKPKSNSKKAIAARRRASKRRKVESETPEPADDTEMLDAESHEPKQEDAIDPATIDTFGGYKWECIAITLKDYQDLCQSLARSKDPNEKILKQRIEDEVVPILQQAEERQRRKIERRERELMLMERMVGAKRSGRLADKQDRERREAEQAEAERKRQADLIAAHKEQEKQDKMERERQFRMMTREQRIKEREYKRILKQEELEKDAAEQRRIDEGQIRGSGRHLKDRIEKTKKELEELSAQEEWTFDCAGCGKYGKNFDDGAHSVACDRCSVWQHSKCLGVSKAAAEKDDFHFICKDCKQKEEDAKKPKISLKFKVGNSSSPAPPSPVFNRQQPSPQLGKSIAIELPRVPLNGQTIEQESIERHMSSPRPQGSSPYHPQTSPTNAYSHYGASQQSQRPSSSNPQPYSNAVDPSTRPSSSGNAFIQPRPQATNQPSQQNGTSSKTFVTNGSSHNNDSLHSSNSTLPSRQISSPTSSSQPINISLNGQSQANSKPSRLPSPILNRPSMSPTQGNMDVGSIAGVPQKSPPLNGHDNLLNGTPSQNAQATPRPNDHGHTQSSHLQTPGQHQQPLSGLSPKKQMTPIPAPISSANLTVRKTGSTSPHLSNSHAQLSSSHSSNGVPVDHRRSISGTPVLPPVENLRPSPEQMRKMSSNLHDPVPTPSKQQPSTAQIGHSHVDQQHPQTHGLGIVNGNGTHALHHPPTPQSTAAGVAVAVNPPIHAPQAPSDQNGTHP